METNISFSFPLHPTIGLQNKEREVGSTPGVNHLNTGKLECLKQEWVKIFRNQSSNK